MFGGDLGVGRVGILECEREFQVVEKRWRIGFGEFGFESQQRLIQHGDSPLSFEEMDRVAHLESGIAGQCLVERLVKRNKRSVAAALLRFGIAVMVKQKMIERREEERAKLAFAAIDRGEVVLIQEPREEALDQIFGVFFVVTATKNVAVERTPISAAQRVERGVGFRRSHVSGAPDQRPLREVECRTSGLGFRRHACLEMLNVTISNEREDCFGRGNAEVIDLSAHCFTLIAVMDLRRVGIVYRKEIVESLRDRRTIISTIVIPLILFPLIFIAFGGFASGVMKSVQAERSRIAIIGGENAPRLAAKVREASGFEVAGGENFPARIAEKQLRAVLEIPAGFEERSGTNAPVATIHFHAGEFRSQMAVRNLQRVLREYREEVVTETLARSGLAKETLVPFQVKEQNAAPPKKVAANLVGGLVPYMIIFLTFVGCMAPALDLTVGEKERGTMETVLASAIGRTELVVGKFFVVVTISAVTTIMALLSNALTLLIPTLLMRQATKGTSMPLDVSGVGVLGIFILVAPLTVTFAAVQMAIATMARNYREAQTYVSPLMMVALVPAVAGLLPGFDLNVKLALVPILNVCLVAREVLAGTFHWGLIGIVFGSSCVYAVFALMAVVKVFKSESVLFRA